MIKKIGPDPRSVKKSDRKNPRTESPREKSGGKHLQEPGDIPRALIENLHQVVFSLDLKGHLTYTNPYIEQLTGHKADQVIGGSFGQFISPDDFTGLKSILKETLAGRKEPFKFRISGSDSKTRYVQAALGVINERGKPVGFSGVMYEITDLKEKEQELQNALCQNKDQLAAFQETVLDLAVQQDFLSLLQMIVERSIALLKVPSGFIYLYDELTDELILTVEKGFAVAPGMRLKMGEGMAGKVAQTRQKMIIDDYSSWDGRSPVYKQMPYHAVVEVPMIYSGQLIGVLGVNDSDDMPCKFTEADAHLLSLFAGQAASVVHDAKLVHGLQSELTERERVEKSLREAEARYRSLVEQIPAIVYTDSAEEIGRTQYISPQIKTMFGFDPDEWSASTELWAKSLHPADRERVLAEYERTFKTGEPFIVEYQVITATGNPIWVREEAVLIHDPSGHPLFWQGVIFNITERKKIEEALEESEERYRRLFDLSPDAIAVHSGGKVLLANTTAMKLIGAAAPGDIIGRPMLDFVHPDYKKQVLERTRQQIAGGKVVPVMEEKFIRIDGTEIDVEVTAAPVHFQDTLASLVIFRDISERKRAQNLQEAVYRIALATETTKSLHDLFAQIHAIISSVMPAENFYITLYDETHNVLRFPYFRDAVDEPYLGEIEPGKGLTAYVLRTGKSLLCTQAVHDELERQGAVKLLGVPSAIWLGVPLIIEGKTIGAMVVQHYSDPSAYGERDQHMLEFVSTQVAIAVSRKQAEDALQRQVKELSVLHKVSLAAAKASNVDLLIEQVTQIIGGAVYVDDFGVALFDQARNVLKPHPSYHGESFEAKAVIPLSEGIMGHVASTGEPHTTRDVRIDPLYLNTVPETLSECCVPIKVDGKLIGVINAESRLLNYFTEDDERLLNTIAGTLATVIEKIRLFDAEHIRRQEAETLRQAAQVVTASLDVNEVLQLMLDQLKHLFAFDTASVLLLGDSGQPDFIAGVNYANEELTRQAANKLLKDSQIFKQMAEDFKPITIPDVCEYKDWIWIPGAEHVRSFLAVPLIARERLMGVLMADSKTPAFFSEDGVRVAQLLAQQMAIALENARLYQEAILASDRRAILHRTSQEIAHANQDPEQVYKAVHRAAVELMPAEAFVITLLDEQNHETVGAYLVDIGGRWQPDRTPSDVGLSGLVTSTGKPVITNDLITDPIPGTIHFGEEEEVRSILAVPLRLGEKVTGMLSVQSYKPYAYTEDDKTLLEMLAASAAIAIENARLYAETFLRLKELEAVNHISTALRAAKTVEEMLPSLLDETLQIVGSDSGKIWLYDPAGGVLREKVKRGWFKDLQEIPVKPGDGITGTVFKTGEVRVSKEFATDPQTRESIRSKIPAGWGGVCFPIRTVGEIIGVMIVSVELPRQLQADTIHLLITLSEMAGNAIRRATLNEQTERQLQRLASLRAVDLAINTILDLRVTLGILIDHIVSQLKVDAVNILLINPKSQSLYQAASSGFHSEGYKNIRLHMVDSLAGQAIRTRTTIHIPNLDEVKVLQRGQLVSEEGFITYFGVPLIAKGQIKGVLEAFHRSHLEPDAEWRDFLETLAGQAAIAIDNSVLFEELQQTNMNLSLAYDATIEGWSKALDLRDQETEGHALRVTELTVQLAELMGIGSGDLVQIRRGALLHDIGKMGIPDRILYKPGALTEEEWTIMRRHPEFAFKMLSSITYLRDALEVPYAHHERWDGSGYPRQLSGEQIPLAARVFAVVDVWDAMISDRPYRKAFTKEAATEFIRENSGKLFDPRVVETFLRMLGNNPTR